MTQVAEIKSPHEQRLEDNIAGKEDIYRESHKRVFKLLERFDGQKPAAFRSTFIINEFCRHLILIPDSISRI